MDIQQIQNVVDLIAQSQLHEVEIKDLYGHIRVKNRLNRQYQPIVNERLTPSEKLNLSETSTLTLNQAETCYTLTSQLIGRIQLAADVISDPLVKLGDKVAVGDTLAYVASLGRLLPVVSDKAGIVYDILINNDDKVEYGLPLFKIHETS